MKSIILGMLAVALVALACGSYRTTTTTATTTVDTTIATTTTHQALADVPVVITTTFTTQYPNATNVIWSPYDRIELPIDWEMTGWPALDTNDYVVEFDMNGQKYYAWYDASGKWIGSSSMLANHGNLPAPVRDLLLQKYNGYTIEKVEQEFDAAGTRYEIKLKKSDEDKVKLHVNEQGVVLKEKLKD
jgi:hypothetical protein